VTTSEYNLIGAKMVAAVSLRMDSALKLRLEKIAEKDERSISYVAQKAITQYLDARDYKHKIIMEAYEASLVEKEFISGEAMLAWVNSWGTDNELPEPVADIFPP
jgi:predicted transcriptional regulator